jgi:nitrogen fixation protein NifB
VRHNMSATTESGIFHPCYYEEAHREYARMHVPVAPECNIQCRFCNRLFDCANETRPGVTSKLLAAGEAVEKVNRVKESIQKLKVVGVAGPGEPLANEETFETLRRLKAAHPEMILCLATNGLLLPDRADELREIGVGYVTVTVNALDPRVGARIYSWVKADDSILRGEEAFSLLSARQWTGLAKCVKNGMVVKVNSVLIPDLNENELPRIAKKAAEEGAFVMNVMPFLPVKGSEFWGRRAPSGLETRRVREGCSRHLRQISHCARCRADAIGLLGCDISKLFQ